jgi:hypothetical protein
MNELRNRGVGDILIAVVDGFLPVRAFGLQPILAATGPIRAVATLRDDSFDPHPAGVPQ